ncbi:MAG: LysR family transcriptional regulator [Myxococcota bacterium]
MNWDALRFVLAVARTGTLTGAATALGVARTTVGRRIRDEEEALGVRLFDRTPDGWVPTTAGAELAETATRVEEEVVSAHAHVLGRDAALRGPLRLSTLSFLFTGFAEIFDGFLLRYPDVELTIGTAISNVSLSRRDADVVLRVGDRPAEHLFGRKVSRVAFGAYAAYRLVQRVGPDAPLSTYPWVGVDPSDESSWMRSWMGKHAPGARVVLRSNDYAVWRHAVGEGIGVSVLTRDDGDGDPNLVRLDAPLDSATRDLWALTLSDLRDNRRIRALMDHLYEGFGPHRERAASDSWQEPRRPAEGVRRGS